MYSTLYSNSCCVHSSHPSFLNSAFINTENGSFFSNNLLKRYIEQNYAVFPFKLSPQFPFSVCCGWQRKDSRNVVARSNNLLSILEKTSDAKEELYAALDLWCGFQMDFPMFALKATMNELRKKKNWKRIIQVSKWMISKGQGKTIGTYSNMLEAYNELKRHEEMEELWTFLITSHLDSMPKSLITKMMNMHAKEGRHLKILEIYGSMEGIGIKPDEDMVRLISSAFVNVGAKDYAIEFEKNYPFRYTEWRYRNGKKVKVRVSAPQSGLLFPLPEPVSGSESPNAELHNESWTEDAAKKDEMEGKDTVDQKRNEEAMKKEIMNDVP